MGLWPRYCTVLPQAIQGPERARAIVRPEYERAFGGSVNEILSPEGNSPGALNLGKLDVGRLSLRRSRLPVFSVIC